MTLNGGKARRRGVGMLRASVAVLVVLAGLLGPAGAWRPGDAATATAAPNRAGVIVDLGGGDVRRYLVEFTASSINGIEMLQRAGADPVVRQFAGEGGAVCALCGQGCPADGSCLTCADGRYWSYWRASSGSSTFSYSRAAASSTQVRDGDVEAWVWGTGGAPPAYASVAQIAGGSSPTTTPPPTPPPTSAATTPAPAPSTPEGPGGADTGGATGSGTVSPGAVGGAGAGAKVMDPANSSTSTSTTAPPASASRAASAEEAAAGDPTAPRVATGGDGGSPVGLIAVAVILAGLAAGGLHARRVRGRGPA